MIVIPIVIGAFGTVSWNWFTVGEGDKLLVSTLLPTPVARTTPSVLLVLGRKIFFRDVIQPQANRENYDTDIFEHAENEDNTKCPI